MLMHPDCLREATCGVETTHNTVQGRALQSGPRLLWDYRAARRSAVVGDPAASKATLLKFGERVEVEIVEVVPATAAVGEAVTVRGRVISVRTPALSEVEVVASDGKTCRATTVATDDPVQAAFECELTFDDMGEKRLVAGFTDTRHHAAFGSSPPRFVNVGLPGIGIFRDGFD